MLRQTTTILGTAVELRSEDGGRTWFMRPASLIAFRNRKPQIATLTDQEKGWLNLIELPAGADLRPAMRQGGTL